MEKVLFLALFATILSFAAQAQTTAAPFICGKSTITDIDGNSYNTVQIGTQCWTKENLKVTKYRDGTSIPTGLSNATWLNATSGAYAIYDNNNANEAIYGKLYNWYVVADSRGLCPTGWHVPTDAEWTTLTTYLGGESVAGGKMKVTGTNYWTPPNTGSSSPWAASGNESGFSALPGGYRLADGSFSLSGYKVKENGEVANFWSATESRGDAAWGRDLSYLYGNVDRMSYYGGFVKQNGFSIRCLRDEQATTTPANQIVRIKSFWKPDQYINTLSGTLSSSTIPSGSKADQWELVKIAGTNFIQIKNVAKPNLVLNIESGTLKASEVPGGFHSGHWELEARANNIMILKNRWKPTFIINIEKNILEASEVPNGFNSAYWLFETN